MNEQNFENFLGIQHRRINHVKFFGIDYSGGLNAGKKIWISEAEFLHNSIYVKSIYSMYNKFKIKTHKESNQRIIEIVEANPDAVFGFDFPFSIPFEAVNESTWHGFIKNFKEKYSDDHEFRKKLRERFKGKDIKRICDIEAKTPFSPYNLRIYKQTFFGISEILNPILILGNSSILPFDNPEANKSTIMEVCPASFLKIRSSETKLPKAYKGNKDIHKRNRAEILEFLMYCLNLKFENLSLERMIIDDSEGDALDSLICIICSLRGLSYPELSKRNLNYDIEGFVYY